MHKEQLLQLLDDKIDTMLTWVEAQPAEGFATQKVTGKWSIGEHLEHLRKTTRAINKGMKLPRIFLRYKFGKNNRVERNYEETKLKYNAKLIETGAKSPEAYVTTGLGAEDKARVVAWMREEKDTMKSTLSKYSEQRLSKYLLPHPLLGRMTFREFAVWTGVHTEHHFELMKRDNS